MSKDKQLYDILLSLQKGEFGTDKAHIEILRLFSVSVSFFRGGSVIEEIDEEIKRVNEYLDISWKHLKNEVKFKNIDGLKPFLLQIETYDNVITGLNVMRERALANER